MGREGLMIADFYNILEIIVNLWVFCNPIFWISDQAKIYKYSVAVGGINIFKTNLQFLNNNNTGKFQH